jgi:tryptophan synthase alpha chain
MAHANTLMTNLMTNSITNPSRIAERFAALRRTGEMGLVAYLTAGDPSLAATEQFVLALAEAGADVIELGVPFSDPVADGPVIQRASERALRSGTTLAGVLSLVKSLRAKTSVPLVLFSYFNPVLQMGLEKFGDAAKAAGADGVLITDLTPEEAGDYRAAMPSRGLDTIFLAAPTSRTGVTGAKDQLADELPALARRVRRFTELPIAIGFGISLPGHVSLLGGLADAAVVGSALVDEIERAETVDAAVAALGARVRLLKGAAVSGMSRREPQV